ncbi:unnamed protein product [Trypanosoma congolense IL3000]|uniref:WGS project CAEQ00000000 data, annotated contig 46 n=1 Tax=Trypanosoma congolense (strain IL3000) TaxID=1068625 RepID=F9WG46_TRYCI|nr:unnamed protein product [Trypanosoma congolense IL3000]
MVRECTVDGYISWENITSYLDKLKRFDTLRSNYRRQRKCLCCSRYNCSSYVARRLRKIVKCAYCGMEMEWMHVGVHEKQECEERRRRELCCARDVMLLGDTLCGRTKSCRGHLFLCVICKAAFPSAMQYSKHVCRDPSVPSIMASTVEASIHYDDDFPADEHVPVESAPADGNAVSPPIVPPLKLPCFEQGKSREPPLLNRQHKNRLPKSHGSSYAPCWNRDGSKPVVDAVVKEPPGTLSGAGLDGEKRDDCNNKEGAREGVRKPSRGGPPRSKDGNPLDPGAKDAVAVGKTDHETPPCSAESSWSSATIHIVNRDYLTPERRSLLVEGSPASATPGVKTGSVQQGAREAKRLFPHLQEPCGGAPAQLKVPLRAGKRGLKSSRSSSTA